MHSDVLVKVRVLLGFAIGGVTGNARSAGNATIHVGYAASFRERRLDVRFAPF